MKKRRVRVSNRKQLKRDGRKSRIVWEIIDALFFEKELHIFRNFDTIGNN